MRFKNLMVVTIFSLLWFGVSLADEEKASEGRDCDHGELTDLACKERRRVGEKLGKKESRPRRGPGEIWVGSPEVFTRERLVNDQLMQDAWLRHKLEEEPLQSFEFQGIVDMRSVVGVSSRTGVEADSNLLSIYEAETQSTLANMQRQQQQNALQHEIDRLEKLKAIRLLNEELQGESDTLSAAGVAVQSTTTDGESDDDAGGTETETPPATETEASPASGSPDPTQPAPGLNKTIGFADRLMNAERSNLLPDPASPTKTTAQKSPLDDFRDRLAYREEIRNEIFENALDDRHDLRGNTAYRLNFDATILPKKKADAWAVVEVEVKEGAAFETGAYDPLALREWECLQVLNQTLDSPLPSMPSKEQLRDLLPKCQRTGENRPIEVDFVNVKMYWDAAKKAEEDHDRKPSRETEELAVKRLNDFLGEFSHATGEWSYVSNMEFLPPWKEVEAILQGSCIKARDNIEAICSKALLPQPADLAQRGERNKLYHRWLRDFDQELNRLLAERRAWAEDCILDGDGKVKENTGLGKCVGDAHLGHEVAAFAQRYLNLDVFALRPSPVKISPEHLMRQFKGSVDDNGMNGVKEDGFDPVEVDVERLRPFVEALDKAARLSQPTRARVEDHDYTIAPYDKDTTFPADRIFLYATEETWNELKSVNQNTVRKLVAAIEESYFWEEDESCVIGPGLETIEIRSGDFDASQLIDRTVVVLFTKDPSISAFNFGVSGGWPSLASAGERLDPGKTATIEVGGTQLTVRKNSDDDQLEISAADSTFNRDKVPVRYRRVANDLEERLQGRGDRARELLRSATEAVANGPYGCAEDGSHGHDKALGFLLIKHLRWRFSSSQGLGDYLTILDPGYDCNAKALTVCGWDNSCDDLTDLEYDKLKYYQQFEAFQKVLKNREHTYAFAATPKETVQRISEVAARRSTMEFAALLSALKPGGAKVDNVTELVLESERVLHGIARQPLVVGFTHGLHFAKDEDSAAEPSRVAHAGWMIGPKFHITEAVWHWPWNKGFRYRHTPIQNNLSVAISVPSWWENAEVAVTTYWRGTKKNKPLGEARRHRHRIELPGTTAGVTNALLESQLPEISETRSYDLIHGQPARLLLIGSNLWRSTRVTLGNQIADEITVLPALGGLVAKFKKIEEIASTDGKKARNGVLVHVWTSTGKRLAGEATIHPANPAPKIETKLALDPPYFIKNGKVSLKLTAGAAPAKTEQLEIQARLLDEATRSYRPAVELGSPKYDAATKTYTVEPSPDMFEKLGKSDARVRLLLVVTPEKGGKIQTFNSEKLGVYYVQKPKIKWVNPESTTGDIILTSPFYTETAFPGFTNKTGVKIAPKATPKIESVRLKGITWEQVNEGRLRLKSELEFALKDLNNPLVTGDKVKLDVSLVDTSLKKILSIELDSSSKEELVVP